MLIEPLMYDTSQYTQRGVLVLVTVAAEVVKENIIVSTNY
jgi:hypothetical protein